MPAKLYDLCAANREARLSPWCWLAKFALLHKGVNFDTVAVPFADKTQYPDPDYKFAPSLDDDGVLIHDSVEIIAYLEKKHPENPFFNSDGERAAYEFYKAYVGAHVFPALGPLLYIRVHDALSGEDAAYFRKTREALFGASLEALAGNAALPTKMEEVLAVLEAPLNTFPFFGGSAPNLSDYFLASIFMWAHTTTSQTLYKTPAAFAAWFARMLDLFDGYARKAPRAA